MEMGQPGIDRSIACYKRHFQIEEAKTPWMKMRRDEKRILQWTSKIGMEREYRTGNPLNSHNRHARHESE